jgi:hypothetical protein
LTVDRRAVIVGSQHDDGIVEERHMVRLRLKTEHAGAKNGGGYSGLRAKAKQRSRKARRVVDRREADPER